MSDAILDELLQGVALEDEEPQAAYGVGKWPEAVLEDVIEQERNEYGYSVRLKFDLRGMGGGLPKDVFLNLPQSVTNGDANDKVLKAQKVRKNNVASIMHAGGLLPAGKQFPNVDNDTTYAKLVEIFRAGMGRTFPLDIRQNKQKANRTDVWGLRQGK